MGTRTHFLQIRISGEEKAEIKRLADAAGQDVSTYVRARALPPQQRRFHELLRLLSAEADEPAFALAELNDFLCGLSPKQLGVAVGQADLCGLRPVLENYVAAMVEQAAAQKCIGPPPWTSSVAPLERPHFAVAYAGLRLHLLRAAPVAFKRRNLFVDSTLGDRV